MSPRPFHAEMLMAQSCAGKHSRSEAMSEYRVLCPVDIITAVPL